MTDRSAVVARAVDYMHRHLHVSGLTLGEIARGIRVSPLSLAPWLRAELGMGFHTYLRQIRIQRACDLLLNTDLGEAAIARQVGYGLRSNMAENERRFRVAFQAEKSTTPREFREQARASGVPRSV